jgi:hypothetical protein
LLHAASETGVAAAGRLLLVPLSEQAGRVEESKEAVQQVQQEEGEGVCAGGLLKLDWMTRCT